MRSTTPIGNAVWFIESRFSDAISLDDIARSAGFSRYQMSRTFSCSTGRSVIGYLRGRPLLIAGLSERYDCESSRAIPAQWQRLGPHLGHVPGQVGDASYGVCCNGDEAGNFDYICGVKVTDFSDLPAELARLRVPAQRYAVFSHRDHISTIRRTFSTIFNKWLPKSGYEAADTPEFERYDKEFDPLTGLEVSIPIKSSAGAKGGL